MTKSEFYYLSADRKTRIHAVEWLPEGKPAAVLQIAHGVTEYILKYEALAEYLTERGFAVVGNDHLGHGTSAAEESEPMYFGPEGSWSWVVKDLHTCRNITKKKFPELPYCILGFSLGSFLARTYLIRYPEAADAAIFMGTGQTPGWVLAVVRLIARREADRFGEDHTTPAIKKLTFDNYNRVFAPNRTEFDWLCSYEKSQDAYIADPMRGGDPSAGLFRELLNGMIFSGKAQNIRKMNGTVPILVISGGMDPVGDCGRGVKRTYKAFLKAGIKDVTMKLYPGLRHAILDEKCRTEIYEYLYQWMKEKMYG